IVQGAGSVSLWPLERRLDIRWVRGPYRPMAIYKLLLKAAIALLPRDELGLFRSVCRWLALPLVGPRARTMGSALVARTPLTEPVADVSFSLLMRKSNRSDIPYLLLLMWQGVSMYMTPVPCPVMEDHEVIVRAYPCE